MIINRTQLVCAVFVLVFLLSFPALFAQQKINGFVTGADNIPLQGVSVIVKGTGTGTSTDSTGNFMLLAKPGEFLLFSFVGYQSKEWVIGTETELKIALAILPTSLEQTVITGYTSQKIKEIAGSVVVVKKAALTEIPAGQVEQMLQGKVAGLTVITSGEPGGASNVRLHGIGNFGDVTPLYIIDGIQGDINSINPYDIESIQVLKDAGAYSIYGVRGANGVIVVTTRKGRSDKTSVTYDGYIGWQWPLSGNIPSLELNPQEQANLVWLGFKNSQLAPSDKLYGTGPQPVLPDFMLNQFGYMANDPKVNPTLYSLDSNYQIMSFNKAGTDWFHELFKPAFSQNHSVSASGGNGKNRYLFSLGWLDQQGTYTATFLKRITARINTDFSIRSWLRFGENLQLAYINNHQSNGTIAATLATPSYMPVYDIEGNWSSSGGPYAGPYDNPLAVRIISKDDQNDHWQIFGNAFAEAGFLNHFSFRSNFGGTLNYNYVTQYSYGSYNGAAPNMFTENSGYGSSWTWTNTLHYAQKWGEHRVEALAGLEEVSNYSRAQTGTRQGFIVDDPDYRFLSNGDPLSQNNSSAAVSSYLSSFFGRLEYGLAEKYFLTATIRRDGSSIFGPQNRFGWFPAFAAAWRISQESFLDHSDWLTELKLRGSWGKTGFYGNTDPLNQYTLYGGDVSTSFYDIFGTSNSTVQGFRTVRLGNPKTGWEQDIVTNLGFESILWDGKLGITMDWYKKVSSGLLFQLSLPDILGTATRPNGNIGNVENTGVDILLTSKGKFSKDAGWDLGITFTTYHNNIQHLNDLPFFDVPLYYGTVRNETGHPMGSFFGFQVLGYFNDSAEVKKSPVQEGAQPGTFKYLDANKDNHISVGDSDMVFIGNPNPKFTIGLNIGFQFKNFDFSTFFYGSFGNDVLNIFRGQGKTALYNSWTPGKAGTPQVEAPIHLAASNFSVYGASNSYPIESGTYFRNKSLMLGYSFSSKWLQRMNMDHFRVYLQALNLFTITSYSGLDPELSGNSQAWGYDNGANYPNNQKQFIIGVNLNF